MVLKSGDSTGLVIVGGGVAGGVNGGGLAGGVNAGANTGDSTSGTVLIGGS